MPYLVLKFTNDASIGEIDEACKSFYEEYQHIVVDWTVDTRYDSEKLRSYRGNFVC